MTLNLGLRYDLSPPYHEQDGLYFDYDPTRRSIVLPDQDAKRFVNPLFPSSLVPVLTASGANLPANLFSKDYRNFVPRFGLAFRPFADGTTVIRGGYGIYTTFSGQGLYSSAVGGPYISNETFTNSIRNGAPLFAFPQGFPAGFGAIGATNLTGIDPHIRNPRLQQWSLTVEREVLKAGIRISYIGDHTTQLVWGANTNQPLPGLLPFNKV